MCLARELFKINKGLKRVDDASKVFYPCSVTEAAIVKCLGGSVYVRISDGGRQSTYRVVNFKLLTLFLNLAVGAVRVEVLIESDMENIQKLTIAEDVMSLEGSSVDSRLI